MPSTDLKKKVIWTMVDACPIGNHPTCLQCHSKSHKLVNHYQRNIVVQFIKTKTNANILQSIQSFNNLEDFLK